MSGKKQHYITQSFLKGFQIPDIKKNPKIFVFKKGQTPFTPSIEDFAAEKYFYSKPLKDGSKTLDDRITAYENKLAELLKILDQTSASHIIDPNIASEFVAHLTIRGAFLREAFHYSAKNMAIEIGKIYREEDNVRALLGIDSNKPNLMLQEAVEKSLVQQADMFEQIGLPIALVKRIIFTYFQENFKEFYNKQVHEILYVIEKITCNMKNVVRDAHNKALNESLKPEERIASLCKFSWVIYEFKKNLLILPDCIAIVIKKDSNLFEPYIMSGADEIKVILCPIRSNKILVGYKGNLDLPEVNDFNEAAAICSNTFFISSYKTPELEKLSDKIGERSKVVMVDSVSSAINNLVNEFSLNAQNITNSIDSSDSVIDIEYSDQLDNSQIHNISYPVSFYGCTDPKTAQNIAKEVNMVVYSMSHYIPLGRLESITFATDYAGALNNLDRGFQALPLSTMQNDDCIGVAMAPIVIRNEVIKVCIIMRDYIGSGLISKDDIAKKYAIYILANQLSRVACVDVMCNNLPDMLLKRIEDQLEANLYYYMHSAWMAYYSSRISASFNPEVIKDYYDFIKNILEKVQKTIPHERLAYRSHGNLDKFLEIAISLVSSVLTHLSMLLGHYDGLEKSISEDNIELISILEKMGLRNWFEIFHRDLYTLFQRQGNWKSKQEFLSLNKHFERIFWQFGIFLWKNDQGEIRVDIPIGTDISYLTKDNKFSSDNTNQ